MKALRIYEFGDSSVLRYEDAERPRPGRGEVLLKVAAAAFNTVDGWFRAGYVQEFFPVTFPLTLGLDVSGTVIELGEGVEDPPVGRDVIGFLPMTTQGADAEYVVAPAAILVDAPSNISIEDAAAIPVAALTAWQSLFELGDLRAGQRVLINGAGGGVGTFAVQLAKVADAYVIATASERSRSIVQSFGADEVVDYTSTSVGGSVIERVDLVVNLVVGTAEDTESLLNLVKSKGKLVTATSPGGDFSDRDVDVHFINVRSDPCQLRRIVALVEANELLLDITGRYDLSEAPLVHAKSEAGKIRGRILLVPEG